MKNIDFVQNLILLYINNCSFIDVLIIALGVGAIVFQLLQSFGFNKSKSQQLINSPLRQAKGRAIKVVRFATFAIDSFPLLGLLGTVSSLLVTFAGVKGNTINSNVIADFAPGLTSTISGLVFAILNLAVFNFFLLPSVEHLRPEGKNNV